MNTKHKFEPLAIIGMSCMFPKAQTLDDYWGNIKQKVDAISEVPSTHWNPDDYYNPDKKCPDHVYAKNGGFLDPVDFNPAEWGISPADLDSIDTSQLLSLVVAQGALTDAGYANKEFDRSRVSVILGLTGTLELSLPLGARLGHPIWRKAMLHAGIAPEITDKVMETLGKAYISWQENSFPGLLGNCAAGRIANRLNLGGTNCVIDAACASTLGALDMAAMELWSNKSDMALVGGIDTFNDVFMFSCFCKTPALSPTGQARPFSADNDGTILGEGIGIFALKRLSDAERDGDKIYALINAVGSSSDGKGKAIYAPAVEGQKNSLIRAYEEAGIGPKDIGLIEAHGTGTGAGDRVEVQALCDVYGNSETGRPWCALGSVKSQIGHTKAAAGSANIIKAALALYHKVIPPTIKVTKPSDALSKENIPFYLPDEVRPWLKGNAEKRYAAVSSMGFGGSNFHVIMSEYDSQKKVSDYERGAELIAISGSDAADVKNKLAQYKDLKGTDLRRAAAEGRKAFNADDKCRLAFVLDRDTDADKLFSDVESKLDSCGDENFNLPNGACFAQTKTAEPVGILFPGQGAQYPGMLRHTVCDIPEAFETLVDFDETIGSLDEAGNTLNDYIYPRPNYDAEKDALNAEHLKSTNIAQPAIGAISLGLYKILESYGLKASGFAGHSYGELVGLCAAGAYDTKTLARLSAERGRLMAQGSGEGDKGGMIAVLGSLEAAEQVVKDEGLDLVMANHNSNRQVVFSGKTSEVQRAKDIFRAHRMKSTVLNVAGAFHSSFVSKAAEPFSEFLKNQEFNSLKQPVYSDTYAEPYPESIDEIKNLLGHQLAHQVRFVEIIKRMYADGIRTFVEAGPGTVLTGLMKHILDAKDFKVICLDSSAGKRSSISDLGRALAQLAVMGYKLNLEKWQNGADWLKTNPVKPKPRLTFKVCGANFKSNKQLEVLRHLDEPVTEEEKKEAEKYAPVKTVTVEVEVPVPVPQTQAANTTLTNDVSESIKQSEIEMTQKQNNTLTAPAQCTLTPSVLGETIAALESMQQQTAELHRKFLEGQTAAQQALMAIVTGGVYQAPVNSISETPKQQITTSAAYNSPNVFVQQPVNETPAYKPVLNPVQNTQNTAANLPVPQSVKAETKVVPVKATAPAAEIKAAPAPKVSEDIKAVLLDVVSEKTGYPKDMLNLEMDMEADLGIDSIKRVEIMSAMQEKLPNAPVVQPDELSKLRTLSQIMEHLSAGSANTVVTAVAPVAAKSNEVRENAAGSEDVKTVLLEVVSEKTGYPKDMLNLEMDMEADLGIDSIKRVEIMSAMQEKLPNAPVVQPDELSKLRTLSQIMDHLSSGSVSEPQAPVQANASTDSVKTDPDTIKSVLLDVVAEKTGYPKDMLNLEMDMEADLGIDSIKRVEIMSAMQEKLPDAPVVQPDELSQLRTLAQIMEHLSGKTSSEPSSGKPAEAKVESQTENTETQNADSKSNSDYDSTLLQVVAEKTGYPVEMLSLEMNMEADLGIDSIKRVEILSAFQEKMPDAPVVQPGELGHFQTIGQILDYLHSNTNQAADAKDAKETSVPFAEAGVMTSNAAGSINKAEEAKIADEHISRTVIKPVEIASQPNGEIVLKQGDLVLITNEDPIFSESLKNNLINQGFKSELRSLSEIMEGNFPADTKSLVIVAPMPERAANGLWNDASEEWLKDAFMAVQKIALTLRSHKGELVTVSRLDGKFGLDSMTKTTDPVQGGLAGITKTTRYEWPEVVSRAIDLDYRFKDADEAASMLASEIIVKGPMETGLSKYSRIKIQEFNEPLYEDETVSADLNEKDVVIVTGGARGVTAETALELAEKYKTTMVLIGRSPAPTSEPDWLSSLEDEAAIKAAILKHSTEHMLPKDLGIKYKAAMSNREVLRNMARFRDAGCEVYYHSASVRNEAEIKSVIEKVKTEVGPDRKISGIIHGAGVLRDRKIEDKTREMISDVVDTKIIGLKNVLNALQGENLKFLVFFSSFSGRFGRIGQVDYAMANEVLNKTAQKLHRLNPSCRVMAFNWGPWDGGMVNSSLRHVFIDEGIGLIPLKGGARRPIIELSHPSVTDVEIGIMGDIGLEKAPMQPGEQKRVFSFDLNLTDNPWLRSHVINGDPVLPMAVAGELMAEAALINNIGMQFQGYDDMRILKGIVLKGGTPRVIDVYAGTPNVVEEGYAVPCEIRSEVDGKTSINARATVIISDKLNTNAPGCQTANTCLMYPDTAEEVYAKKDLFHGEFFQSLKEFEGWSDSGIAAKVKTSGKISQWFSKPAAQRFYSDPMSLDAAYQLMILWTIKVCGAPSLPSCLKKYRVYTSKIDSDTITVSAIPHRKGSMMAAADIEFIDDSGKVAAKIEGYECTINEGLKNAFALNKVIEA